MKGKSVRAYVFKTSESFVSFDAMSLFVSRSAGCDVSCLIIFPSYKPHREQQNTVSSAVERPKQPVAVDL